MQLERGALVEQVLDERVHVVGALRRLRQSTPHRSVSATGADLALVAEQRRQAAGLVVRVAPACRCDDVHDAGAAAVRLRAAEAQRVDVLAGDRADDVRAGDEDPAVRAEDDDVGERGAVRGAAGGRAEHDRDLRHLAGRAGHDREDLADGVQGHHALAQPGAAGVPEADDRDALGERALVGGEDRLAAGLAHRAALDRWRRSRTRPRWRPRSGRCAASIPESSSAVMQLDGAVVGTSRAGARVSRVARVVGLVDHDLAAGVRTRVGRSSSYTLRNGEGDVVAAEAERVVEGERARRRGAARGSPRTTSRCDLVVGVLEVDRRRRQPVVQREHRGDRLDRAGRAEQVTGHRLGAGRHGTLSTASPSAAADRLRLGDVADRRRGGVRVDVRRRRTA